MLKNILNSPILIEQDAIKKCGLGDCKNSCSNCHPEEFGDEIDFVEMSLAPTSLRVTLNASSNWFRVNSVKEIMEVLDMIGDNSYAFVAGNTAHGESN